ncbi:Na(+)/H(+) antiporter subunit E [Novipirellula galeiformis]|uniref:Na(+)/H(+) antiporter subunit E n=1 Tax=Novipirellula galeiformis TaxID=2528004 RepID=A0A5C6CIW3_9BACT|nr:Na+/H+ antiporter subunit E [Novipirellula galeiformis]TWU23321.1 Na(+)/H(+) antiporter subunit E [Novipirellula galeiformis]
MIYTLTLAATLFVTWLTWSGHFESPFILGLGVLSCLCSLWMSRRMRIVDEEGAPAQLGVRPFTRYAPWLIKEIVISNLAVAKIILSPKMPLQRKLVTVPTQVKTELGRVMLANSITLTPGTVSVRVDEGSITIHALVLDGDGSGISADMERRICELERPR